MIVGLSGSFVKAEKNLIEPELGELFLICLYTKKHKKKFYAKTKLEQSEWIKVIQKAIGYTSFFSFYNIKVSM